jgi:hypothetical protein
MRASIGAVKRHFVPALPQIPEAVREKLTGERIAEATVIAAAVTAILILSTALQLGLERYAIGWM